MSDQHSVDFEALVSRERSENAFADALRLFIGRGKRFTVKQVAIGTGLSARTIECLMERKPSLDRRPVHLYRALTLAAFLGADFTNQWLGLAQQGAFDLPEDEPDPGEIAADSSDDSARVVRMALDGRFDEEERQQLPAVGARMMRRGAQLVALRARA